MILVCAGTRPEMLKLAPVVEAARAMQLPVHVHCSNQQPDLLDPAVLPWETEGGLTQHLLTEADCVVVQGDTRTAFQSAVHAFEAGVPVFHVEAGVRTFDLNAPWPEEGYRRMLSQIATYHACTTFRCRGNLLHNGISAFTNVTGSPIVESVRARAGTQQIDATDPLLLVTLHRRENRGHFTDILAGALRASQDHFLSTHWLSHPNGWATRAKTPLHFSPPDEAVRFAQRLASATVVLTDSGGVQEECNALGVPCVVARSVTDRPESLGEGGAVLGGVTEEGVYDAIGQALDLDRETIRRDCFGDGTASHRIAEWWGELLA